MSERMNDVIWICHSSECEGTWIESTGNDQDDRICPSVDCENKNTTPYIKRSTLTALQAKLEKAKDAVDLGRMAIKKLLNAADEDDKKSFEYAILEDALKDVEATLKDLEGE